MKLGTGKLRLAARCVWKHNTASLLLILGLICCISFPTILYSISVSLLNQREESKKDTYGDFTAICYTSFDWTDSLDAESLKTQWDSALDGFYYQALGCMYLVKKEASSSIFAGFADKAAEEMGMLKLQEGRMAFAPGELAATNSALVSLGCSEPTIGTDVVVFGRPYRLTGIVQEYGRLWPKGENQITSHIEPLNVFLCRADAEILLEDELTCILLMNHDLASSNNIPDNPNFFLNTNRIRDGSKYSKTPLELVVMLLVALLLLVFNVFSLAKKRCQRRYEIYGILGMTKKEKRKSLLCENFLQFGTVLVIGIPLSFGGVRFSIFLISLIMNLTAVPLFSWKVLLYSVGMTFLLFFCLAVTQLFDLTGTRFGGLKKRKPTSARKTGWFRLFGWEVSANPKIFIASIFLAAVSLLFLGYSQEYRASIEENSRYVEVDGKMPYDYDYEFCTSLLYSYKLEPGDLDVIDYYNTAGAAETDVSNLSQIEGIKEIRAYKGSDCLIENTHGIDLYLDQTDGFEDGTYDPREISASLLERMGYDPEKIITSSIMGFPEAELERFSSYVVEGDIDLDSLRKGKEVILVVPAYQYDELEEDGNTIYLRTPVSWDSAGANNDTLFSVDENISVSVLMPTQKYIGAVQDSNADDYLERHDFTTKIGAIIRSKVGWFGNSPLKTNGHYLITVNEALHEWGLNITYDHVRFYTEEATAEITDTLMKYQENLPDMTLEDIGSELYSYHVFQMVTEIFCRSLEVLVFVTSLLCMLILFYSKGKQDLPKYALLRVNGLSILRITSVWAIYLLLILACGSLLSLLIWKQLGLLPDKGSIFMFLLYGLLLFIVGILLICRLIKNFGMRGDLSEI